LILPRQSLFFAFGYNALGIPIAAGVSYPMTGGLLSPFIATLAMSLSSVSVRDNALRLRGQGRQEQSFGASHGAEGVDRAATDLCRGGRFRECAEKFQARAFFATKVLCIP